MNQRSIRLLLVLIMGLTSASAFSQEKEEPKTKEAAPDMMNGGMPGHREMMMQREMRAYPWIVVGGTVVGTLATVALALFVALEVQWIRHWHRRLKSGRTTEAKGEGSMQNGIKVLLIILVVLVSLTLLALVGMWIMHLNMMGGMMGGNR